jgi:hypothetical protein
MGLTDVCGASQYSITQYHFWSKSLYVCMMELCIYFESFDIDSNQIVSWSHISIICTS